MKYRFFLLSISLLLLLWCSQTTIHDITFNDYHLDLKSSDLNLNVLNQQSTSQDQDIYKAYISDNSWFTDSIIIYKSPYHTSVSLEKLADINLQKLQDKFKWFKSSKISELKFNCDSKSYLWYIISFTFNSINIKEKIYINQLVFLDKDFYNISTSTQSSKQSKQLLKMLKSIRCN